MSRPEPVLNVMVELALPVYVPSFLSAIARGALFLVLPLYALEQANGPFLAGLVLGARGLSTMLMDIPAGLLVGRFGDKNVMLLSLAMLSGVCLLGVLDPSAILLLTIGVGVGAFSGSWILARTALVTEHVGVSQRGRVVSIMAALERAGTLVGPLAAGFGIEYFGYKAVFACISLCFLLPFIVCMLFTKTYSKHVPRHVPINLAIVVGRHIRILLTGGSVMVVLAILRSSRGLIVPAWGVAIGLSSSEIGIATALGALVDTLMFLPAGLIFDYLGRKVALMPCLALLGVSIAILPLTETFLFFTLVVMLSGLGNGFGTGIFMTLGGDFAPRYGRNHFLGVWRFIGDSGQAIGPTFIGSLAGSAGNLFACLCTGSLAAFALVVLFIFVPEPNKLESDSKN